MAVTKPSFTLFSFLGQGKEKNNPYLSTSGVIHIALGRIHESLEDVGEKEERSPQCFSLSLTTMGAAWYERRVLPLPDHSANHLTLPMLWAAN